ncbi:hypothetical protein PS623_00375 [Pseudomonas fluorescens]|nr:hypothetical protein PS623_00375 [Pseudomonas fluorescens]
MIASFQEYYTAAASDEELLIVSRPKIKSALESIRSALEYTAQDIWKSYSRKQNSVYFPYGVDDKEFRKSLKRNLPGLAEQSPVLFSLLESIQPHISGKHWLPELCALSNFNKHNGLTKQVRKNSPGNTVKIGSLVQLSNSENVVITGSFGGVELGKNGPVKLGNSMTTEQIRSQINESFQISREFDWVEFHYDGSGSDLLAMLKMAHSEVSVFVEKVREHLLN